MDAHFGSDKQFYRTQPLSLGCHDRAPSIWLRHLPVNSLRCHVLSLGEGNETAFQSRRRTKFRHHSGFAMALTLTNGEERA